MEKLQNQDWSNPFKNIKRNPYCLIAAGEGARNITMPDGSIANVSDIKRDLGYDQLFAWNLEQKALLEWVEFLHDNPNPPCRVVVDSGAYSMWSRGKEFNLDEYITFLNSKNVIETAFWVAEADVIPGRMGQDPTEEERANAPEKSWENYLYMIERVKIPKKITPIFHQGEDFKHLIRMITYKFEDGDYIPYIGISPRNDVHVNEKIKWYEQVWRIINEHGRQDLLTHNFGMTTIDVMEQYPSYSSDSTSWLRSAAFGNIGIVINSKIKTVYVSNRNTKAKDHILNQSLAVRESVEQMCKEIGHGIELKHLLEDDNGSLRMVFNLYALDKWRKSFVFRGNNIYKKSLF